MTILSLSQVHCQDDESTVAIVPVKAVTVGAVDDADSDDATTVVDDANEPTTTVKDDPTTEALADVTTLAVEDETTAKEATTESTTTTTTTEKPTTVITLATTEATTKTEETTESTKPSTVVSKSTIESIPTTESKPEVPKPTIIVSLEAKKGFLVANDDGSFKGFLVDVMDKICKELKIDFKISTNGSSISKGDAQLEYIQSDASKTDLTFTREVTVEMEAKTESNFNPDLFLIFRPFTTGVWLLILLAFFLIGLSLFLFNVCHPHEHMAAASRGKSSNHDARYFHILGSYWTAFSTLMLQGYERKPRTTAGRILLGFWFLFVIFTVVLYITSMFNIISSTHQIVEDQPEPPCNPGKDFAFAFSKDNKDLSGLDDSLEKLQSNDDMLNMQKQWFDCPASKMSKRSDDPEEKVIHLQIGINSFSGAMIILVIGLAFAILVALLEVCCHRNKHKQVPTSTTKENLLGAEEGQATNDMKEATNV